MVFHGGLDTTVLPNQSERIVKAYQDAKLPVDYIFIPDGKHQDSPYFNKENTRRLLEFLKKHLLILPEVDGTSW